MSLNRIRKIIYEKIYINKKLEGKINPEISDLGYIITKLKNSMKILNIRLVQTKGRINKLKNKFFQIIQSEKKQKNIKKNKGSLRKL